MKVDDEITCRLFAGGKVEVYVWDRVPADRSAGQYEAGWWCSEDEMSDDPDDDFFLSESGILYGHSAGDSDWRRAYQHAIGMHVPTVRKSRDFERMIEAMHPDFDCGTQV